MAKYLRYLDLSYVDEMRGRILIIDDNVSLTTMVAKALGHHGFQVAVENDSLQAVDRVRRERPDLVVLDIMMPQKDGGEVLGELRNDPSLRAIPVILLTGLADQASAFARMGGIESSVFGKPVELRVLVAEIDRQLGRRVA